jgi:hypothetical protein
MEKKMATADMGSASEGDEESAAEDEVEDGDGESTEDVNRIACMEDDLGMDMSGQNNLDRTWI